MKIAMRPAGLRLGGVRFPGSAQILLLLTMGVAVRMEGQTTVWTGSGNWNSGGNWSAGTPGAGAVAVFDGQGGAAVSVNGNQSARGLSFSGGLAYTLSGNNTLSLGVAGMAMSATANQLVSVSTVAFGNNSGAGNIAVTGSGVLTVGSAITGGGGVGLNKTGTGTLVLSGVNTFTTNADNGVRIQAGVLQVAADNNLGNAGNIVRIEGGTLRAAGTFTASADRQFRVEGSGGAVDVIAGNRLTLNTADRLRGSAALAKTGAGVLEVTQANVNYTGNVTVSGGTLRLANQNALGINAAATHTVATGATLEAAFASGTNFQANLVLAGGSVVRTIAVNTKAGFQNNNSGSSLTVTANSLVRDATNDGSGGFLTFDGVVSIQSGARLTADAATAGSEVRFGGGQAINLAQGATLATSGAGLVSLGSGAARVITGEGTGAAQSTLVLGAANHASNAGSRFQVNGTGVGGLRVEGTKARVDAFATDARLAATTGTGGTLTLAYTDAGSRTLGVTANLAAARDVMLGLESAGGGFTLSGSLANWGGLVVGPSTTVSFGVNTVFGAEDALVMRGGTLALGGTTQVFDRLEVLGSSVLDFGAGDGVLAVDTLSIAEGATLTVRNWTQTADYFFSLIGPGEGNLGRVYFEAQDKTGAWNKFGDPFEITPVPEPSAYGAAALGGLLGWAALRRKRRAKAEGSREF